MHPKTVDNVLQCEREYCFTQGIPGATWGVIWKRVGGFVPGDYLWLAWPLFTDANSWNKAGIVMNQLCHWRLDREVRIQACSSIALYADASIWAGTYFAIGDIPSLITTTLIDKSYSCLFWELHTDNCLLYIMYCPGWLWVVLWIMIACHSLRLKQSHISSHHSFNLTEVTADSSFNAASSNAELSSVPDKTDN